MPWKENCAMTERMKFIVVHQEGLYTMTELCERFGVARKTGYKWLERFAQGGPAALAEKSRAPHQCPRKLSGEVEAALLDARAAHPTWGPRKLLTWLAPRRPDLVLPSPSTVGELLSRRGLCGRKRRPRTWKHPGSAPLVVDAPNQVWCADFKGQFRTRDGVHCYPLTVTDAHSRFLLGCTALLSVRQDGAHPVFVRLFQEYGLPAAIRTDNGVPFATQAIAGLSALNVYWLKLGITHQRIEPGRPEQNGRHERMHRTLKAETTRPPEQNQAAQQHRFDCFRAEFNEERPHEALEQATPATPASCYAASPRLLPERVPEPEYPGHYQLRRVSRAGCFRFQRKQIFLSDTLEQEDIGLEEVDDGIWSVYFYNTLLCRLDERDCKLRG